MKRKIRVGVIDYGMGNLHSVAKAIALQGGDVFVSNRVDNLNKSDLIVLPGVGAFGAAVKNLRKNKLSDFVGAWVTDGKPYLGICLGYQLLFERSEECPKIKGLGLMKGDVVRFKKSDFKTGEGQIPHMGWNTAALIKRDQRKIFAGIKPSDRFYFVHSFFPVPAKRSDVLTETNYGTRFASSVSTGNIFASQFHPEKSGEVGLNLLRNYLHAYHPSN